MTEVFENCKFGVFLILAEYQPKQLSSSSYTDPLLLQQIAAGNEQAFRRIFREHWQNIYGVAYMLTKSSTLAEDMVQEIFLKVWLKREQLPQIENFRNFLFIVARNHIFSELRKKAKEQPFTENLIDYFKETGNDPERQLLHKEASGLIQEAINRLPLQQRTVYQLSRVQGLSRDEIALQLGISPNTVRNHMAKALEAIRQHLQQNAQGLMLWICMIEVFLY